MMQFVSYDEWFDQEVWKENRVSIDYVQSVYNMYYLAYLVKVPYARIKNLLNENLYIEVYRVLIMYSRGFLNIYDDEISEEYRQTVISLTRRMQKDLVNSCSYMIRDYATPQEDKEI